MGNWSDDLKIEDKRMRCIYKLINGHILKDIRDLHIPGDMKTTMKTKLEIKGWHRNGTIPIETWSVLEKSILGWGWNSGKEAVWFVRVETGEAIAVDMPDLKNFLIITQTPQVESLMCEFNGCKCGTEFVIRKHEHPSIIKQAIQASPDKGYHSACLFVKPEAFNFRLLSQKTSYLNQYDFRGYLKNANTDN